jgi:hypothetical protein
VRVFRRVAVVSLGLFLVGCTVETGTSAPPPVRPPSSVFPSANAQATPGLDVTEEQLRRADPCALVDSAVLAAYGDVGPVETPHEFTECEATVYRPAVGSQLTVRLGFDFAFPESVTLRPVERDGVTVHVGDPGEYGCRRGVVVAERAVINIHARDDANPADLCAVADRVLDAALPKLIAGDLPAASLPEDSLADVDACALLRPDEVFRLRGIDRTQVTPGFDGQHCTWGVPHVSDSNVFVSFGPASALDADSTGDRWARIGGLPAVVHPQEGGSNPDYRTLPGCEVRMEHRKLDRPGSFSTIEEISVQVSADADERYRCSLATDLAEAAVARLP